MSAVSIQPQTTEFLDTLLAGIATRIQLPPSRFAIAEDRYHTLSGWIDREGSPLHGFVTRTYAQGSMAIGATINSCTRDDEFDIDALAELALPESISPREVLNLLYEAIRGEPGSRYYDKTERCTRCIQVQYGDDMHVDITPTILLPYQYPREGYIFHAKLEEPSDRDRRIIANPYGFAEWFMEHTPAEDDFATSYAELSRSVDVAAAFKSAEAEPVPAPIAPYRKSRALVTLQLLKRWRNIRYDGRPGRKPPSVLMAKLVGDFAGTTNSLFEELQHQSWSALTFFQAAHANGQLVYVENPKCESDVFSDRWPGNLHDQKIFIDDLRNITRQLDSISFGASVAETKAVLSDLFGENPTADAVLSVGCQYGQDIAQGRASYRPGRGGFAASSAFGILSSSSSRATSSPTPVHRFYGGHSEEI